MRTPLDSLKTIGDRLPIIPHQEWRQQAACADAPPDLMFGAVTTEALETCANCPVRRPCRLAGKHEPEGIWGGLTPLQRGFRNGYRIGGTPT